MLIFLKTSLVTDNILHGKIDLSMDDVLKLIGLVVVVLLVLAWFT